MKSADSLRGPQTLRILQVNSLLTGGGTDDQCIKLTASLAKLGQAVWIAGPDGRECSKTIHQLQIPFHATPPEGPLKLQFILSAARFIRASGIEVLHGHHGRDLWPTVLAARLSGRRPTLVLSRHLAKSPSSWFSRRFLLGRCDAVIAVSDFVAKVLREGVDEPHSPVEERRSRPPMRGDHSKIRVIHNGIDTDRFRPTEDRSQREQWGVLPNQLVFAVIGGYDLPRGKGQREFLRAAAAVQSRLPQGRFLIIGRGNLKETLEKDILDLGLTGKAWLTPYCFDMPGAMNATDCLVHPQVGTEALGGVVLEAFACGKPVIASNLDGIPEGFALGGYGALVPAEDVDALARAMLEQAQRPALGMAEREALHRRLAAQCSVAENARKVLRLYQEIHAAR